jgi:hypothetical protein
VCFEAVVPAALFEGDERYVAEFAQDGVCSLRVLDAGFMLGFGPGVLIDCGALVREDCASSVRALNGAYP